MKNSKENQDTNDPPFKNFSYGNHNDSSGVSQGP